MFCGKCGALLNEGSNTCEKCGAVMEFHLENTVQKENVGLSEGKEEIEQKKVDPKAFFIEPDEQLVAELGNGYFVNLLFAKPKKCSGLLTDKRVYLKGTFYEKPEKSIMKTVREEIVDVEDITGTGFSYQRMSKISVIWGLICALATSILTVLACNSYDAEFALLLVMAVPFAVATIVWFVKAFMSKKTMFYINYAGGSISFDAALIGLGDVRDFQKQIRRVKDMKKGK